MWLKWRKKNKSHFKVGDRVVLRPNWQSFKKFELCAYIKDHLHIGEVYIVDAIGDASKCLYLSSEGHDMEGHSTCKNSPELFILAMTIEECIDTIYQKVTEALLKQR